MLVLNLMSVLFLDYISWSNIKQGMYKGLLGIKGV